MITVRNLSFNYSQRCRVFDNLSLTLPAGEIVGLLGRNGAGKSTLFKLFAQLLDPQQGAIDFGEKHLAGKADLYRHIMVVPEEFSLPKVTVSTFVATTAPLYPNFSMEQFDHYCSLMEVDKSQNFGSLSMGQRKKAYIAFALACNVAILLLDEPTNGLDIMAKGALKSIFASYIDESKTLLISTHQAHDIEALIDRVVIIDQGTILLNQTVCDLQRCFGFGLTSADKAIFSTQSIAGTVGIWAAEGDEESRFDLELLFNAAMKAPDKVQSIIAQKRG